VRPVELAECRGRRVEQVGGRRIAQSTVGVGRVEPEVFVARAALARDPGAQRIERTG